MLLCTPQLNARADVGIHINVGGTPSFVIETWPSFIYLPDQGFSVAVGSPYDIIYYGNSYYVYHRGYWYRSRHRRGPWAIVRDNRMPYRIRRHRWEEIRRFRDIEYRRHNPRFRPERRMENRGPRGPERRMENRGPRGPERRLENRGPQGPERRMENRGPQGPERRMENRGPQGPERRMENRGPQGPERRIENKDQNDKGAKERNSDDRNNERQGQ